MNNEDSIAFINSSYLKEDMRIHIARKLVYMSPIVVEKCLVLYQCVLHDLTFANFNANVDTILSEFAQFDEVCQCLDTSCQILPV